MTSLQGAGEHHQESTLMAQNYTLHGGPWHGHTVAVQDGRDHIHVIEPVDDAIKRAIKESPPEEGFSILPTREGMYSRVFGMPGHMEWDGWRSHD